MTLAPRAVLVHRTTEYEELLARHGTHGQAAFFLSSRDRDIREVAERHHRTHRALIDVAAAVPHRWRQSRVERADLDRFLFGPEDVVVVVGQDGLVANAAKYLSGQPVVGIDTDPGRNPGVLVRHRAADTGKLLAEAVGGRGAADELTMVEAVADDSQRLLALNEICLGPAGHQTVRYRLSADARPASSTAPEPQASSGVLVGTGTGATGWLRSLWQERASALPCPPPPTADCSGSSGRPGPPHDRHLTRVGRTDTQGPAAAHRRVGPSDRLRRRHGVGRADADVGPDGPRRRLGDKAAAARLNGGPEVFRARRGPVRWRRRSGPTTGPPASRCWR